MDFNRQSFPPGGWVYIQPQTGWMAPTPTSSRFDQTRILIYKHRVANKAIVAKHGLSLSLEVIGNELEAFNRIRLGIGPASPKSRPLRSLVQSVGVAGVVADIKKAAVGVGVITDWLGEGMEPVPVAEAEARAAICVLCPNNGDLKGWLAKLEQWAAEKAHDLMEARKDMGLRTSRDEELAACQVCNCNLPLKVWVPMRHIIERTPMEQLARLSAVKTKDGSACWIASGMK